MELEATKETAIKEKKSTADIRREIEKIKTFPLGASDGVGWN